MSITAAKTYRELEAPVVNQNGYLGSVDVLPPGGPHDLLGVEYLTDACAPGETWTELCYGVQRDFCTVPVPVDPTPPTGGYKVFGQPELVTGAPFAVYDGVECQLENVADSEAKAVQRLAFSEPRQVDYNVLARLDAAVETDLTPTGTMTLADAIARMEDMSSALYGSYGVLSMPRSLTVVGYAQQLLVHSPNGGLQTINGTQVVAVAQEVPGGPTPVYLTGRISLIQGPVRLVSSPSVTMPNGTCRPQRALAERLYVPLVECMVVKATATA